MGLSHTLPGLDWARIWTEYMQAMCYAKFCWFLVRNLRYFNGELHEHIR